MTHKSHDGRSWQNSEVAEARVVEPRQSFVPFRDEPSTPFEQKVRYLRKASCKLIWILIIGAVAIGVYATILFMERNDIKFSQGQAGNTPVTLSELALHNSPDDCWVAIHGKVYDLTSYARRHPGGSKIITNLAGLDGTIEYDSFHPRTLLETVEGSIVGPLSVEANIGGSGEKPGNDDEESDSGGGFGDHLNGCDSDLPCVTMEEVMMHSSVDDCWIVIHGNVYNLTAYAHEHPGGSRFITNLAGTDATLDYDLFHTVTLLRTLRGGELIGRLHILPEGERTSSPSQGSRPSDAPVYNPAPITPTKSPTLPTYDGLITFAELQSHNTADDCWVAIHGKVYDLSEYAQGHPGGSHIITNLAGTDATASYALFHSTTLLMTLRNGELQGMLDRNTAHPTFAPTHIPVEGPTPRPTAFPTVSPTRRPTLTYITITELQTHSTIDDCWVAIHGQVFDLSAYAKQHPGGQNIITNLAGTDGTTYYTQFHSEALLSTLQNGELLGFLDTRDGEEGSSPIQSPTQAPETPTVDRLVTWGELGLHNTADDCWVAIHGRVYDMTSYARNHPGGRQVITRLAGTDGTADFELFHSALILDTLRDGEFVGIFDTAGGMPVTSPTGVTPPTTSECSSDSLCISLAELETHNQSRDCWVAIHGNVYDLTAYASRHPGGARIITNLAGTDATAAYSRFHSPGLLRTLREEDSIGWLEGSTAVGDLSNLDEDDWDEDESEDEDESDEDDDDYEHDDEDYDEDQDDEEYDEKDDDDDPDR